MITHPLLKICTFLAACATPRGTSLPLSGMGRDRCGEAREKLQTFGMFPGSDPIIKFFRAVVAEQGVSDRIAASIFDQCSEGPSSYIPPI